MKKNGRTELYMALAGIAGIVAGGAYLYQRNAGDSMPQVEVPTPTTGGTPATGGTLGGTRGTTAPVFGVDLTKYYGIGYGRNTSQPVAPQTSFAADTSGSGSFGVNLGRYL